jgi:hypothetical protein
MDFQRYDSGKERGVGAGRGGAIGAKSEGRADALEAGAETETGADKGKGPPQFLQLD